MANLNSIFSKKETSKENLARQRLSKETGNSGFLVGTIFCGVALVWALLILLAGASVSSKIKAGIVSVLLVVAIIFLSLNYVKQKNAMSDILEAFLSGERNISNIVAISGLSNKVTTKLIQNMISKGIIADATIDRINNRIVDKVKSDVSAENAGKTVICTGCGAKNTLTGNVGQKCEYCGAALSEVLINDDK